MSRHLADHRNPSQGGRVKHFLRLDRTRRSFWHRPEAQAKGNRRLVEYLRIERGRTA
jgi:hypothetical protein